MEVGTGGAAGVDRLKRQSWSEARFPDGLLDGPEAIAEEFWRVNAYNPLSTHSESGAQNMSERAAPADWRLGDLHHLGLTVRDLERSIVFYRDVLGMTLHRRRPQVDNEYVALQTGFPGVVLNVASFKVSSESRQSLELVQYMNGAGPQAEMATNRPGSSHLCLTVNDLHACYASLKAQGVTFKSEPVVITSGPNAGGLVVYFYDPDGYTLELFQPPG